MSTIRHPAAPQRKALVLGGDERSCLSVIRSLGRAGIQVHLAWHAGQQIILSSKYVARAYDIAMPAGSGQSWKQPFLELLKRERFDLVVPCPDGMIVPLYENLAEFSVYSQIAIPAKQAYERLSDKFRSRELADQLGVPVPRQRIITKIGECDSVCSEFDWPLVLKPRMSVEAQAPDQRRTVAKVRSREQFIAAAEKMLVHGPVAVQENFIGRGAGVELLLNQGTPLLAFQHLRLHEPLMGGGSSYRMGVPLSPDLHDAAIKMLAAVRYTGVAMVEFKINANTGKWVFVEVNARFWGSLPLALASGVDFPLALFELLVEGRTRQPHDYRLGLCARNLTADLWWQGANRRADRADPTLMTLPRRTVIWEIISHVLLGRERIDTFTLDDPKPMYVELGGIFAQFRTKFGSLFLRFGRNIRPFRKLLEWRSRAALRRAKSILFVCKGNICRSPFAEGLARKIHGSRYAIASAGYYPASDRPSPPDALAAAREFGVDLAGHHSAILSANLMRADVILVFDEENYVRLLSDFPNARRRIFLLGALNAKGPLYLSDPWNKGLASFQKNYADIDAAIRKMPSEM